MHDHVSTREQLEATLIRAYYPAWSVTGKEDAGERMTTTNTEGRGRTSDEWNKRAGYPLLLCKHRFFCFFLFGQLERPSQDFGENDFQKGRAPTRRWRR